MMAEDFRIGNYINYRIVDELDERKDWYELSEIDTLDLQLFQINKGITEEYKPIEITEEWLTKLGLQLPTQKEPFHFKKSAVEFLWSEYQNELKCFNGCRSLFSFPCKYIHQLQNVYYAITGEELTIKK